MKRKRRQEDLYPTPRCTNLHRERFKNLRAKIEKRERQELLFITTLRSCFMSDGSVNDGFQVKKGALSSNSMHII